MITVVSGFVRSGTSLMMQMLSAGGVPVFHDEDMGYPSFETQRIVDGDTEWVAQLDGGAVKWLDPTSYPPPIVMPHQTRVLWMKRNYREQGRSAVKFLQWQSPYFTATLDAAARLATGFQADEAMAIGEWENRADVLVVHFEQVIHSPRAQAERVCEFLGRPLNVGAMAGQVRSRGTNCLTYMLEPTLWLDHAGMTR